MEYSIVKLRKNDIKQENEILDVIFLFLSKKYGEEPVFYRGNNFSILAIGKIDIGEFIDIMYDINNLFNLNFEIHDVINSEYTSAYLKIRKDESVPKWKYLRYTED